MTLSQRRERTRAEQGFGGLSMIELHEEQSWQKGRHTWLNKERRLALADAIESQIRWRIAAQPYGIWEMENPRLRFGVPDGMREYRIQRKSPDTAFPWSNTFSKEIKP